VKIHATAGVLRAANTNCVTGETREVQVNWEVRVKEEGYLAGETWLHLIGGVTGYESVCLDDENIARLREGGWHACAGTKMRWDAMFVPANEMDRVLDEILVGDKRITYLAAMTELDASEGVSYDELQDANKVLMDLVRWLYGRLAHYSCGVVDLADVPRLEEIKALKWIHEKEGEPNL